MVGDERGNNYLSCHLNGSVVVLVVERWGVLSNVWSVDAGAETFTILLFQSYMPITFRFSNYGRVYSQWL